MQCISSPLGIIMCYVTTPTTTDENIPRRNSVLFSMVRLNRTPSKESPHILGMSNRLLRHLKVHLVQQTFSESTKYETFMRKPNIFAKQDMLKFKSFPEK